MSSYLVKAADVEMMDAGHLPPRDDSSTLIDKPDNEYDTSSEDHEMGDDPPSPRLRCPTPSWATQGSQPTLQVSRPETEDSIARTAHLANRYEPARTPSAFLPNKAPHTSTLSVTSAQTFRSNSGGGGGTSARYGSYSSSQPAPSTAATAATAATALQSRGPQAGSASGGNLRDSTAILERIPESAPSSAIGTTARPPSPSTSFKSQVAISSTLKPLSQEDVATYCRNWTEFVRKSIGPHSLLLAPQSSDYQPSHVSTGQPRFQVKYLVSGFASLEESETAAVTSPPSLENATARFIADHYSSFGETEKSTIANVFEEDGETLKTEIGVDDHEEVEEGDTQDGPSKIQCGEWFIETKIERHSDQGEPLPDDQRLYTFCLSRGEGQ